MPEMSTYYHIWISGSETMNHAYAILTGLGVMLAAAWIYTERTNSRVTRPIYAMILAGLLVLFTATLGGMQ